MAWYFDQNLLNYFSFLTGIFKKNVFEGLINVVFTSVSFNKDACHLELLVNVNSIFKYSLTEC
jgi:hypothetical protein